MLDLDALEAAAREALPSMVYDYYAGGAEQEATLRGNRTAWDRWWIRPHVLRDVASVSTATTVLGTPVGTPVLVAPTAYQRMADAEGEAATARGAASAGTLMVVSTLATTSLEDVAAAAPGAPRWFQLYIFEDRGFARSLLARAKAAGYGAIVLTVDAPILGHRPRDARNGFTLPDGLGMANLPADLPETSGSGLEAFFSSHDKRLTPDDLAWIRAETELPLVVKGLHRGDDAARCVDAGADAVVVSNHGGRQLDGAIPTALALPEVVEAVAGQAEVYVDGGIRRGVDVFKALALGAQAVLVGRPVLWGLATHGAPGVAAVLGGLSEELARAMTLAGTPTVADITSDLVTRG